MKEVRNGVRHMLSIPWIYDTFQKLVGAYVWRDRVMQRFVLPKLPSGGRLIDIGCGTGEAVKFLPKGLDYVGFDRNSSYIEQAIKNYGSLNVAFRCEELSVGVKLPPADIVLALGLIHHLEDEQVVDLLHLAKTLLMPGGFLLTLDPLYNQSQSRLAKYIISKDRGTAVRDRAGYEDLMNSHCTRVEVFEDLSPLRIPYTGIVYKCYFD